MHTYNLNNPYLSESSFGHFIGRDRELNALQKSVVEQKKRVVAISGNNATGKTSLWRVFLDRNKELYNEKIEVIHAGPYTMEIPKVSERTQLIIIEDLSFENSFGIEKKVIDFIKSYPEKQFIVVGAFEELLDRFGPDLHIHLKQLSYDKSTKLLLRLLEEKVPQKDLWKIAEITDGHPYLLRAIAQYLNENSYDISKLSKLINENIHYLGLKRPSGTIITESSFEYKHIVSDIRLVNKSILDKIRRQPNDIYNLTPRQFEEMVAELMTRRGYTVDLTKITRDGGKDMIIANHVDIGNFIYYVECKKYAPTNPIGVNLVRELAGTISADRVTAGILITSSYFSPDAIQFSEKFKHQISLIDFIRLKKWLKEL